MPAWWLALIPACWAELRATQSRPAERLGLPGYGGVLHAWAGYYYACRVAAPQQENCWLQFSRIAVYYLASYCTCKG